MISRYCSYSQRKQQRSRPQAPADPSALMGSPINPIVWLANKMAELDDYLKAGEIIISGSLVTPVRVQPGSNITFIRLGSVGATFVP